MRLVFLGTPAFAVPTLEAIVAGRARGGGGAHAARPAARPRAERGRLAREGSGAAPGPAGVPAGARAPARSGGVSARHRRARRWWWWATGRSFRRCVIDLAPLGIINVHASLLPKYRGAGPIQWAIVQRRDAHRRDHDADRCRAGHGRHAAEGGDRDRPRGERHRTGQAAGGDGRGAAGGDAGAVCEPGRSCPRNRMARRRRWRRC